MNSDNSKPIEPDRRHSVDPLFDGHLETPLLKMTVQQRLDWIDEMMRLRTEWQRVPPEALPPRST